MKQRNAANRHPTPSRRGGACSARGITTPHPSGRRTAPYSPSPRQMERGAGGEANWIGSPSSELPPAFLPAHARQEEAPPTAPYSPPPPRRSRLSGRGVARKAP